MARMDKQATLGTLLRSLIDQLDPAVERAYEGLGLGYRPRFTPVVRILRESGIDQLHSRKLRSFDEPAFR